MMKFSFRLVGILAVLVIATAAFSQTKSFKFAWLTDTHVGSSNAAADLSNSVHDINTLSDISFVILSGDVTEMGLNPQFDLAKGILDSLNKPYYIIPGNHDTKWSASGCTQFTAKWGADRFVFEFGGYRFIGLHQGPIMKMGDGHFAQEDVRWLDSVLTSLPDKNQPLFFVTHYPLDPGIDNWFALTDRLKHYNIQAVLVGHGHNNHAMKFEGIPGTMARSNLRARGPVSAFTIADVQSDTIYFSERPAGGPTKNPWHKIALGRRSFANDTTTYSRPDFSINEKYKNVHVVWTTNTGYTIASTPSVWNDFVVIGNSSGAVHCYNLKTGSPLWTFKTGATVYSTSDIADGKVVIGSSDKNIYCLDIKSGKLIWKVQTGAPVVAAAKIDKGIVYIGGSDGVFRAIDLKTGSVKWEYKEVAGFVEAKALVDHERVIFGAWDTYLYALNTKDGSLAWKWSNGNSGTGLSPAACWPVAAQGKIFIVAPDRVMTAIDAESGKTVWRSNRYQVRECIGLSEDGQRVYARCMTDTVLAFAASASSPSVLWATACGYGYDIDPSMPLEKDGVVQFGTKNGLVYGLDSKTGSILWERKIGVTIVNTPAPLSNHRLVVSDLEGTLSLLEYH